MIELISKLIVFPFTIMGYVFKFMIYFLYAVVIGIVWFVQIVINLVKFLISLFKKNYRPKYVRLSSINEFKDNTIKKDVKRNYDKKSDFDREADLWGLSKEDRRIAKEERMTPADYIEAEERDDDELFTDEWE